MGYYNFSLVGKIANNSYMRRLVSNYFEKPKQSKKERLEREKKSTLGRPLRQISKSPYHSLVYRGLGLSQQQQASSSRIPKNSRKSKSNFEPLRHGESRQQYFKRMHRQFIPSVGHYNPNYKLLSSLRTGSKFSKAQKRLKLQTDNYVHRLALSDYNRKKYPVPSLCGSGRQRPCLTRPLKSQSLNENRFMAMAIAYKARCRAINMKTNPARFRTSRSKTNTPQHLNYYPSHNLVQRSPVCFYFRQGVPVEKKKVLLAEGVLEKTRPRHSVDMRKSVGRGKSQLLPSFMGKGLGSKLSTCVLTQKSLVENRSFRPDVVKG